MTNITVLECLKCGAPLEITSDLDIFKCPFCAMVHLIKRSAGSIELFKLEEKVDRLEQTQNNLQQEIIEREFVNNDLEYRKIVETYNQKSLFPKSIFEELIKKEYDLINTYKVLGGTRNAILERINPIDVHNYIRTRYTNLSFANMFPDHILKAQKNMRGNFVVKLDKSSSCAIWVYSNRIKVTYTPVSGLKGLVVLSFIAFNANISKQGSMEMIEFLSKKYKNVTHGY